MRGERKKEERASIQFGDIQIPIKTSILDILTRGFLQYVCLQYVQYDVKKDNKNGQLTCGI